MQGANTSAEAGGDTRAIHMRSPGCAGRQHRDAMAASERRMDAGSGVRAGHVCVDVRRRSAVALDKRGSGRDAADRVYAPPPPNDLSRSSTNAAAPFGGYRLDGADDARALERRKRIVQRLLGARVVDSCALLRTWWYYMPKDALVDGQRPIVPAM